ncbi:hypothetical protein [Azospirillum sp. sgz302134]
MVLRRNILAAVVSLLALSGCGDDGKDALTRACVHLGSVSAFAVNFDRPLPVEESSYRYDKDTGAGPSVVVRLSPPGLLASAQYGHRVPSSSFTVNCQFADIPRDERVPPLTFFSSWDGAHQQDKLATLNQILGNQYRIDGGKLMPLRH